MSNAIILSRYTPVALASVLVLGTACNSEPTRQVPVKEQGAETVVVTPPVLDRLALLGAIDRAASAYASGQVNQQESLSGQRFLIRQAMGCQVPLEPTSAAPKGVGALIQVENSSDLKLTLSPADWTAALDRAEGTEGWEAAEGFWLTWPWLRTDGCPRPPLPLDALAKGGDSNVSAVKNDATKPDISMMAPTTSHTAGLAAVFEVEGSRLKRRMGRAYEYTLRGDGKVPLVEDQGGYRLVMEGRIAAFADGRAIRCRAASADQRPVCVMAVHLERVAFETSGGQQLSEWRGG